MCLCPHRLCLSPAPCPPRPCPHPAGGARSPCGDERLENSHLVPLPYLRGQAASSGGPRAPGDRHNPPPGPLSSSSPLDNIFSAGTMRGCGSRLVWLLVLSLAWLGPALGGEDKDEEVIEEEEKEKKEDEVLSDEIKEEDNVLVLHEHNFARALSEHQLLLVEFCECPHCGQGCGQGQMWGREYWQGALAGQNRHMDPVTAGRRGGVAGERLWVRGARAQAMCQGTGWGQARGEGRVARGWDRGQGHRVWVWDRTSWGSMGSHSHWAVLTPVPIVRAVPYPQTRPGVGTASGWPPPLPRQPPS